MTTTEQTDPGPIDAVITWVNGSAPAHSRARARYMAAANMPLHENAVNPHRWFCNDEIRYCVQSIHNHAPWTRSIWIVVDDETPDLSDLSENVLKKVRFVYHRQIFAGFEQVLPTFNSLAIESMMWRIDGLSERFMYFNDDVFLTAPLMPGDVFQGLSPVLRGKWVDYSALPQNPALRRDPAMFNHFMQINAAAILGYDPGRLFSSAHVVHPLRRSVMARLFDGHKQRFVDNITHRFRDLDQFLPQGLHNHACIASGQAVFQNADDHRHIKSGQGMNGPINAMQSVLHEASGPGIKFLCVNDLSQLEQLVPDARQWLGAAIGGLSAQTPVQNRRRAV